jgi:hypothetical protein
MRYASFDRMAHSEGRVKRRLLAGKDKQRPHVEPRTCRTPEPEPEEQAGNGGSEQAARLGVNHAGRAGA